MIKNLLNILKSYLKNFTRKLKIISKWKIRHKLPEGLNFMVIKGQNTGAEVPNLSYIEELSNSDIDFQNEFLRTLSEEYSSEWKAYMFCIEMGAPRAAAAKVGKLKDKLNILGMKSAFRFAERHQRKLQKGNKSSDGKFKKILAKGNRFLNSQVQVHQLIN